MFTFLNGILFAQPRNLDNLALPELLEISIGFFGNILVLIFYNYYRTSVFLLQNLKI